MENEPVWVVAYINRDHIAIAQEELTKYGHKDVEAYIPTVRLLTKKFKGKNHFEFVPLLFNYGFFKIPLKKAKNPDFLMELRHHITCIYAWVKDPAKVQGTLRKDNKGSRDALPAAAIASDKEVARMIKASQSMSIHCAEDLDRFRPGDYLKLEGYPFEGMPAEIISINKRKGEVRVRLGIENIMKEVTVSFENVFYTIYKDYSEEGREKSTDEMVERYGPNSIDHIIYKNQRDDDYGGYEQ